MEMILGNIVLRIILPLLFLYAIVPNAIVQPLRCGSFPRLFLQRETPESKGLTYEPFTATTHDSLRLTGWYVHARADALVGTIVLLHGYASCKERMLSVADFFSRNGFDVVLYDARAHGESEGTYCSFGYFEASDVSRVVEAIWKQFNLTRPVGLYGRSLGAVVALRALARDQRFQSAVLESPFEDFRQTVSNYLDLSLAMGWRMISDVVADRAASLAHFSSDSVVLLNDAHRVLQPVLVAHGLQDVEVSAEYGKSIFDHLGSPRKVWYPIPSAGHNDVFRAGGAEYEQTLIQFFRSSLSASSQSLSPFR